MSTNAEPVASYGTAKSGVGVSAMAVLRPDLMMKCVIPVVMAGIIGVGPLSHSIPPFRPHKSLRVLPFSTTLTLVYHP